MRRRLASIAAVISLGAAFGERRQRAIQLIAGVMRGIVLADLLVRGNALLERMPEHRDVRLWVAIAQRNLGQVAEALQTLAALERYHPRYSRLHEERGHCHVALRQAKADTAAVVQYLEDSRKNPAMAVDAKIRAEMTTAAAANDVTASAATKTGTRG